MFWILHRALTQGSDSPSTRWISGKWFGEFKDSEENYNEFLNSLNTVSKQVSKDLTNLTKREFLDIYGHLRPGTYDILSLL